MSEDEKGDMNPSVSSSQRMIARHHAQHNRRTYKAIVLLLLAVLAGCVIGIGSTVLYFNKTLHRVPPRSDAITQSMLERIRELTGTTPEEESKLTVLLEDRMDEVDELRRRYYADSRRVFEGMDTEIEGVIGHDRSEIWREYKKKRHDERQHEREMRRGGRQRRQGRHHR